MIVFKNIPIVGCLFHFIKTIRLKALKSGIFSNDLNENTENLIKELGSIPFLFNNNNDIIEEIFEKCKKYYEDNYILFYNNYKLYFLTNWQKY